MKYLTAKDDISQLEGELKNKFKWEWLQIDDFSNEKINVWCKKIDIPGVCFCTSCNTSIRYASEGIKALTKHSKTSVHVKARKSVRNSQYLQSFSCESVDFPVDRTVDLATRKCRTEALITSFLAEHSLPYVLAPELLELTKVLSKDITALNYVTMCRATAAYKLKYGLAKTIKDEQFDALQRNFFSLNVDESTSNAEDSILSVLVQYYSDTEESIILRHLMSLKLSESTSDSIFKAITSVIEDNNIPWSNLISVLMDSCNAMRGTKNGVELKIRKNKAPNLLDIDGDTCHHVNNCAKKFTQVFLQYIEALCDDVYFDLKRHDKRELFFELCRTAGLKPLKPLSRPDHRWLYVLVVIERLEYLWDILILYFFSWLPVQEVQLFKDDIKCIIEDRKLSSSQEANIKKIQSSLKKKSLTKEGKNRKERIIKKLFEQKKKRFFFLVYTNLFFLILMHMSNCSKRKVFLYIYYTSKCII